MIIFDRSADRECTAVDVGGPPHRSSSHPEDGDATTGGGRARRPPRARVGQAALMSRGRCARRRPTACGGPACPAARGAACSPVWLPRARAAAGARMAARPAQAQARLRAPPPPAGARQRWCGGPGAGRATCGWHCVEPGGVRASRSRLVRRPHLLAGGQAARAARAARPQVRHPPPPARLWGRPGSPWPGPCVRVACGRPRCAPARARRGDALGRLF